MGLSQSGRDRGEDGTCKSMGVETYIILESH